MTGSVEGSGVRGVVVGAGGADLWEETEEVKTEGRVSLLTRNVSLSLIFFCFLLQQKSWVFGYIGVQPTCVEMFKINK